MIEKIYNYGAPLLILLHKYRDIEISGKKKKLNSLQTPINQEIKLQQYPNLLLILPSTDNKIPLTSFFQPFTEKLLDSKKSGS